MAFGEISRDRESGWLCILLGWNFVLEGTQAECQKIHKEYLLRLVVYEKKPLHGCFSARLDIFLALLDTRSFWNEERTADIFSSVER